MRTACLLLILVVACKTDKQETKPSPPPAPEVKPAPAPATEAAKIETPEHRIVKPAGGINTTAEYEAKAFDLTDKLTSALGAAGTSCAKLADTLEVFIDENKAALAATDQFEAANPFAEDDLEPKLQTRAKPLIEKMMVVMQKCGNDQRVQAAMAKLPD
jgi:hypothetical protein